MSDLARLAEAFCESGALGRPGKLSRLFEFLLESSVAGRACKEVEIAIVIFGREIAAITKGDAVVRVYMHKLRQRLDQFYAQRPPGSARILIPKGEYRLQVSPTCELATPAVPRDMPYTFRFARMRNVIVLTAVLLLGVCLGVVGTTDNEGEGAAARRSDLWRTLFDDSLPITVVLGDYYLLGEVGHNGQIGRLVRDFSINSDHDLIARIKTDRDFAAHYRGTKLSYLPTGTAAAMRDLLPLFMDGRQVNVRMLSELDGATLKNSHIVYLGWLSGLGMLEEVVFARSRFLPGSSYDELVDLRTTNRYVSDAVDDGDIRRRDYGYLATFPGPAGNRVVVIAGMRDAGLIQLAHLAAQPTSLTRPSIERSGGDNFEALIEIQALGSAGVKTVPLVVVKK